MIPSILISTADETIPRESSGRYYDFPVLFGNGNPVEIEIGCGRGKFLVNRAHECRGINFIGIDRVKKWMRLGQRKKGLRDLENLHFFKQDIREFLISVPPQSISVFHMYFPDPWPKRRHHDRRTITPDFLALLAARLTQNGSVYLATDDGPYYRQIQNAAEHTKVFWSQIRESRRRLAHSHLRTSYELKFERLGKPLFYMELIKK